MNKNSKFKTFKKHNLKHFALFISLVIEYPKVSYLSDYLLFALKAIWYTAFLGILFGQNWLFASDATHAAHATGHRTAYVGCGAEHLVVTLLSIYEF